MCIGRPPQNVSKKLILWCIKEKYKSILWLTHPQVQIWQMHFSSFLAASEAEEGFLVASVETMLWCDPRFLTRQKREFYSECWAQQRPQGRLTSSPVMLKAQMDIQVCTVNRSAQSSTIPASLRRTKRQMPRCEQKGCATYLFFKNWFCYRKFLEYDPSDGWFRDVCDMGTIFYFWTCNNLFCPFLSTEKHCSLDAYLVVTAQGLWENVGV